MDEFALGMSWQTQLPSFDERFAVDVRGPGEWIVGPPAGERPLHVYRLAAGDWLVSEVGRGNEGRGADLMQALLALTSEACLPDWWRAVAAALDGGGESGPNRASAS